MGLSESLECWIGRLFFDLKVNNFFVLVLISLSRDLYEHMQAN